MSERTYNRINSQSIYQRKRERRRRKKEKLVEGKLSIRACSASTEILHKIRLGDYIRNIRLSDRVEHHIGIYSIVIPFEILLLQATREKESMLD